MRFYFDFCSYYFFSRHSFLSIFISFKLMLFSISIYTFTSTIWHIRGNLCVLLKLDIEPISAINSCSSAFFSIPFLYLSSFYVYASMFQDMVRNLGFYLLLHIFPQFQLCFKSKPEMLASQETSTSLLHGIFVSDNLASFWVEQSFTIRKFYQNHLESKDYIHSCYISAFIILTRQK